MILKYGLVLVFVFLNETPFSFLPLEIINQLYHSLPNRIHKEKNIGPHEYTQY